jgi:hypothetical protein
MASAQATKAATAMVSSDQSASSGREWKFARPMSTARPMPAHLLQACPASTANPVSMAAVPAVRSTQPQMAAADRGMLA